MCSSSLPQAADSVTQSALSERRTEHRFEFRRWESPDLGSMGPRLGRITGHSEKGLCPPGRRFLVITRPFAEAKGVQAALRPDRRLGGSLH
jgi:hypothetical protein